MSGRASKFRIVKNLKSSQLCITVKIYSTVKNDIPLLKKLTKYFGPIVNHSKNAARVMERRLAFAG